MDSSFHFGIFLHSLNQFRIRKVTKDKDEILRFQEKLLYKCKV